MSILVLVRFDSASKFLQKENRLVSMWWTNEKKNILNVWRIWSNESFEAFSKYSFCVQKKQDQDKKLKKKKNKTVAFWHWQKEENAQSHSVGSFLSKVRNLTFCPAWRGQGNDSLKIHKKNRRLCLTSFPTDFARCSTNFTWFSFHLAICFELQLQFLSSFFEQNEKKTT